MKKILTIVVLAVALFATAMNAQEQTAPKKVYNEEINPLEQIGVFKDALVGVTIGTVDIDADDVIDLIYKLKRPYRKNATFITNDSTINAVIEQNFVYIHVNYHPRKAGEVGKALMKRLNNAGRFGFPVFVVLDGQGNIIHIQDSGYLEEDKSYNAKKVLTFFQQWTPKAVRGE